MTLQMKIASDHDNRSGHQARQPVQLRSVPGAKRQHCQDCALNDLCAAKSVDEAGRDALHHITSHPRPGHKGEHFYRQDDPFNTLYIVRCGAVKTYYLNNTGEEHITGFYLPGEIFGIDGINAAHYRYSAQALDTTAVCAIPYHALERLYAPHPQLQQRITNLLCEEIFQRQQPLLCLRQHPAEARLASFLLDISSRFQQRGLSATAFSLPMARRDIARYVGLAEETMSRLFTRFVDRGLLSIKGRNVSDLDLENLQALTLAPP